MEILHDTVNKWAEKQHLKRQEVHIPTSLLGVRRGGTYTRQYKNLTIHGTVRIQDAYGEHLASYATCRHAGMEIMCLAREHDPYWQGIDARPIQK